MVKNNESLCCAQAYRVVVSKIDQMDSKIEVANHGKSLQLLRLVSVVSVVSKIGVYYIYKYRGYRV